MDSIIYKLKRNLKEGTFFKNVPTAIKNRFIKKIKVSNLIYRLDNKRILTKKYQSDIPTINANHIKAANYYIDKRIKLHKDSIVYSLGILTDTSFDSFISKQFGCNIFMYDPTPKSIAYMKNHESNTLFKFNPIGVWIENTTLKFYEPKHGGSSSLIEGSKSEKYFEAKCLTMESIMKQNNHKKITVFKADIEGAALPILNQMVANKVFPNQIIVEFERPTSSMEKVESFFKDLSNLRKNLKNEGYEEFLLPRNSAKYFSLEMLFVNPSY